MIQKNIKLIQNFLIVVGLVTQLKILKQQLYIKSLKQFLDLKVAFVFENTGSEYVGWRRIFSPVCVCVLSLFSHVQLFATPWDCIALQAPMSTGSSRQEYWSGLPCWRDLPDPEIKPASHLLHWQVGSLPLAPLGKPWFSPALCLSGMAPRRTTTAQCRNGEAHKGISLANKE